MAGAEGGATEGEGEREAEVKVLRRPRPGPSVSPLNPTEVQILRDWQSGDTRPGGSAVEGMC